MLLSNRPPLPAPFCSFPCVRCLCVPQPVLSRRRLERSLLRLRRLLGLSATGKSFLMFPSACHVSRGRRGGAARARTAKFVPSCYPRPPFYRELASHFDRLIGKWRRRFVQRRPPCVLRPRRKETQKLHATQSRILQPFVVDILLAAVGY